jgi:hypothetical protein
VECRSAGRPALGCRRVGERGPTQDCPARWFRFVDQGTTEFLPDCAVIPSLEMPGYLGGHDVDGGLAVPRGLTGRLARWRVPLATLGQRLAELATLASGSERV